MDLRQLRYFTVLADELHFGRAARRLSISQPPLSFSIKQLESHLGASLFERSSKGVKLTPAGMALRESAAKLLQDAAKAEDEVRHIAKGTVSRIRIGFVGSMLFRGLPEKLSAFHAGHALVDIALTELNSAEQVDAMMRGQIDLGFVHTEKVPPELKKSLYLSEQFVCCVPAQHPFSCQKKVDLRTLSSEPFILFSRSASPDYYERILALCAEKGLQPRIRHEVRHWLSVVSLVAKGTGVALVPAAMAGSGMSGVSFLDIGPTKFRSSVYCIWREKNMPLALPALLGIIEANRNV